MNYVRLLLYKNRGLDCNIDQSRAETLHIISFDDLSATWIFNRSLTYKTDGFITYKTGHRITYKVF